MKNILNTFILLLILSHTTISYATPNFGFVAPGLYRSGQPSVNDLKALRKTNITTILKLNLNTERNALSATTEQKYSKKIEWFSPIDSTKPANCVKASKIADQLEARILRGEVILVHCTLGRDRTGLIIGLWKLKYMGATYKSLQSDWKRYGTPFVKYQQCLKNYK